MTNQNTHSGKQRTSLVRKNIVLSFIIKAWNAVVQLLLVPLTLGCLNQYEYGIWLTVSSLMIWIDTFDIGLGNGLRNKLAEALARDDKEQGQRLVSTTFLMLIAIVTVLVAVLLVVLQVVDVNSLFNADRSIVGDITPMVQVVVSLVGATFVFKFIGNVYLALQLPAVNNMLVALGQTVALLGIVVLKLLGDVTLMQVAMVYTASPLLVYLLSYPVTFTRYSYLRPRFQLFVKEELRPLFSLGIRFFLAQIAGLVIFASSNILISNILSPSEVTPYQIAYRYFGIANILFTIISAPLWSATTDAYTRGDMAWVRQTMGRMRLILLLFAAGLTVMTLLSQWVYTLWVGSEVSVGWQLSMSMALYIFVLIYGTCYSNMICGFGKISVLTITTIVEAVIYIPLGIFMGKHYGLIGFVGALILVNMISAVVNHVQYNLIVSGKASGIWLK